MLNMNIVSTQYYYKSVFSMLFISLLLFFRIVNYSFYHPKAKFNTSKIKKKHTRQQQQHKLHITKQHITTTSRNFGGKRIYWTWCFKQKQHGKEKIRVPWNCKEILINPSQNQVYILFPFLFISIGNGKINNLNLQNCHNNNKH